MARWRCKRCGHRLFADASKRLGYGPGCAIIEAKARQMDIEEYLKAQAKPKKGRKKKLTHGGAVR